MNKQAAVAFIRANADQTEQARQEYILSGTSPSIAVKQQLFAGLREDGGWHPFWAADYSSLDTTRFRLAQAEQLGLFASEAAVRRTLDFIAQRQRDDGRWEIAFNSSRLQHAHRVIR